MHLIRFIPVVLGLLTALSLRAQEDVPRNRAETWDFWIPVRYHLSTTVNGSNGTGVDLQDGFGFGMGFGYNFTDHVQLGGLFDWNYRPYDARTVGEDGSTRGYGTDMEMGSILLTGAYYPLAGRLTPFLGVSLGYTYLDTNIPTGGPPYTTCYWDPWWGYVCGTTVPTASRDGVSYGLSLGVRYDVTDRFALQLGFSRMWLDISDVSSTPDFDSIGLSFILRQ